MPPQYSQYFTIPHHIHYRPILYNRLKMLPNSSSQYGGSGPHQMHGFLGPSKRHLDLFSLFKPCTVFLNQWRNYRNSGAPGQISKSSLTPLSPELRGPCTPGHLDFVHPAHPIATPLLYTLTRGRCPRWWFSGTGRCPGQMPAGWVTSGNAAPVGEGSRSEES